MRILATALVAVFLCAMPVSAHWLYEPACCSDRDCTPVDDDAVTETPQGFRVNRTGEFVERSSPRVRKPLNEKYHLCEHVDTKALLCIYPKLQGF